MLLHIGRLTILEKVQSTVSYVGCGPWSLRMSELLDQRIHAVCSAAGAKRAMRTSNPDKGLIETNYSQLVFFRFEVLLGQLNFQGGAL